MSSETITRTDLTNILNEVLPPQLCTNYGGNLNTDEVTQAGTTKKVVTSFSFTSSTGRFLVISSIPMKTSRNTSTAQITVDGVVVGMVQITNSTALITLNPVAVYNGNPNTTHTIALCINSQDSGTTATKPSYNTAWVYTVDLIK